MRIFRKKSKLELVHLLAIDEHILGSIEAEALVLIGETVLNNIQHDGALGCIDVERINALGDFRKLAPVFFWE